MHRHVCLSLVLVLLALIAASSCSVGVSSRPHRPVVTRPGPPAHAPAHGYRRKQMYRYWYYPSSYVYFDVGRKLYFYMEHGNWAVGANLPAGIRIDASEGVSLSLEADCPYIHFHTHKAKYPPGQLKKVVGVPAKGPGEGKAKGKRKSP